MALWDGKGRFVRVWGLCHLKRKYLSSIKGTGSISPVERLSLQGDIIYARSSEDRSAGNPDNDVGIELDGTARYKLDDNLSLMGGVAYLIAGDW